ncbi:MAG: DUF1668 domain-containing protein [Pirellulales bacterium]
MQCIACFGRNILWMSVAFSLALSVSSVRAEEGASSKVPDLPFGITSFGAVRSGNALYVYGGNTGGAHSYSNDGQSNQLLKLELGKADAKWTAIGEGQRLQGLALVAYKNWLIRVGGFNAHNEKGAKADLHSVDTVTAFDLTSQKWIDLPSLPSARSSHDAIVVGSKLYVVGGWKLDSPNETKWHETALMMDLDSAKPEWKEMPKPPFERRALALAHVDGKIYAVGGMDSTDAPTKAVVCFDLTKQEWKDVPSLPTTDAMGGFGAAAWDIDGKLVVSSIDGSLMVLAPNATQWEILPKTKNARFFHRILPFANHELVSIGGASMQSGKFLESEIISIPK